MLQSFLHKRGFVYLLVFLALPGIANNEIKSHWSNLSYSEYVDNLVSCQVEIKKLQWSHSLWPKENKKPKPSFSKIISTDQIRQQVLNDLKMQSVLDEQFNTKIDTQMLQTELDRMSANSKDPKRLAQLYAQLDNNPQTIALCVALPNLTKSLIQEKYNFSQSIHADLKQRAHSEFQSYKQSKSLENSLAKVHIMNFVLRDESKFTELDRLDNAIELDSDSFHEVIRKSSVSTEITEEKTAFIVSEVIERTPSSIKIKSVIWEKITFENWLQEQFSKPKAERIANFDFLTLKYKSSEQLLGNTLDTWTATSLLSAPTGSMFQSNVWTGNEMIVWGGTGNPYNNIGSRYNPITDTWISTTITGAPSARSKHSGIWTGTEMIIWGGVSVQGLSNTGGRYDPLTDSWTSTGVATNVPTGRVFHTATWSGSEMIIWGGYRSGGLNTGGRYDPVSDNWLSTDVGANVPIFRLNYTAIWSGSEMIIWGGYDGNGGHPNIGGRYDPVNDSWVATSVGANAPTGRSRHTAIWSGSEMIVWGGYGGGNSNTGGRYDPVSDSWLSTDIGSNVPTGRYNHTAIWSGSEMIVWGGYAGSLGIQNTGAQYNLNTGWTATSTIGNPGGKTGHSAFWTGSKMIVWGGNPITQSGGVYSQALPQYTIGGTTTGLANSNEVKLLNNAGDELTVNANGSFTFANAINDGSDYVVTVSTQPSSPKQTCVVTNDSGTVSGGNVTDIAVTCSTNQYSVGGLVTGLAVGNSVTIQNNGSDDIVISSDQDGGFNFPVQNDESGFNIVVSSQPTTPSQTCNVTNGTGSLAGVYINNVSIVCSSNTYSVGGNITGLAAGNSVILQNNSGDDLTVSANGVFTFNTTILDETSYAVTVLTQPSTPNQTCVASTASGAIAGSNITNVNIICSTNNYTTGGTVSGLASGNSVTLQNNLGDNLTVSANDTFVFSTSILDESAFAVTVLTQPTTPNQTCILTNATGFLAGSDITNVAVVCSINTYSVGGPVTGLAVGNSLTLQNNAGDAIVHSSNSSFAFSAITDQSNYEISVSAQPTTPNQTCGVINESGIIAGSNVTNVAITCSTNSYVISGTVSGLADGNNVVLQNNLGDDLSVSANGVFTFASSLIDENSYAVTVLSQPTSPNQTCALSNQSGTLAGADINNISITCTSNTYTIGGTVTGLATSNSLTIQNNGGDDIIQSSNGVFTFSALVDESSYAVTVSSQPDTPNQVCVVTNDTGVLAGDNVSNVNIDCSTSSYSISGTVSGLASGNSLVVQNNTEDDLTVSSNGFFAFSSPIIDENTYAVTVLTQPTSPNQTCVVTNSSGTVAGANIVNITIACSTNTYTVGGNVSGLAPGNAVVLQNNTEDNLTVSADGGFTFSSPLIDESAYHVTVLTQPTTPSQTCVVSNASSNLAGVNITNVSITCSISNFSISGVVSGLASGNAVVLQNNVDDDLTVSGDGSFSFISSLADESSYAITVLTQPTSPNQTCVATNDSGTLAGAHITDVTVVCSTNSYTIGGSVFGLAAGNSLVLRNNSDDDLNISANDAYVFSTAIDDESSFAITVLTQPTTPNQTCVVANSSSTVAGSNINNANITCTTTQYTVSGMVTGLAAGNSVSLQNNGTDTQVISNDGTFSFTAQNDETVYLATVSVAPTSPNQLCSISNAGGTINGADVDNVTISCSIITYSIGGNLSGLAVGNSLVIQNNLADDLTLNADGGFTFNTSMDDLEAYSATVLTQPTSPNQTCIISNASGNLAGSHVNNVNIVCTTTSYNISGNLSGLAAGNSVILQNNGNDDLSLSSNGLFSFLTALDDESAYLVTVLTQPTSPNQSCVVSNDSGVLAGNLIDNVSIVCTTITYTVGGSISGLASGNSVVLQNNMDDNLTVVTDGSFEFNTAMDDGSTYAATVLTQPTSPNQNCIISNNSSNLNGANVTNISIVCNTITYTIGGEVSGLLVGNSVTIRNNAADNITLSSNGAYTFDTAIDDGSSYDVSVFSQPNSPIQTCVVKNGMDSLAGSNVVNVVIVCIPIQYTIGGTLTGLSAGNSVVLQSNGSDDKTLSSDGVFTFATALDVGTNYTITVLTQPNSPNQICTITNGSGVLTGNVTEVGVLCLYSQYTISGTVSGLTAGNQVVLQNNAFENKTVTANGSFSFDQTLDDGSAYAVTVLVEPLSPNQNCVITNGSGTLAGSNISNVTVVCTIDGPTTFSVGGDLSSLSVGSSITLQNNEGDDLIVTANGTFTFDSVLSDFAPYEVSILHQPENPNQECTLSNESGSIFSADVTNILIFCLTKTYFVHGTVIGLAPGNQVIIRNNMDANKTISSDGPFSFDGFVTDGADYEVIVVVNPLSPTQNCTVTGGNSGDNDGTGTMVGADVTDIVVSCSINSYTIGGTVSGLSAGNQVVLQNNLADNITVTANDPFTFSPQVDGSDFSVTVLTQPDTPNQTCLVTGGVGGIMGTNNHTLSVACTTNKYTIGGTLSGLAAGSEVVLRYNGAFNLTVSANGSFTFIQPLDDEAAYTVFVLTQPTEPNQVCTVTHDSGTIAGANITDIIVECSINTYKVGGFLSGLATGNTVVLQNDGADDLNINAIGLYDFATELPDESDYAITVLNQPTSPNQTCVVSNPNGTLAGLDIGNAAVACTTNTYTVGGDVTGLAAGNSVTLLNNAGNNLVVSANEAFVFTTALTDETTFDVSVGTQPTTPDQNCEVTFGNGSLAGSNVTGVKVDCSVSSYSISGTVSGLAAGNTLLLQNNATDNLLINDNGAFTFSTAIDDELTYAVTVLTQPSSPNQNCILTFAGGTLAGANITNVTVVCTTNTYTISGIASGLAVGNNLTLQNNFTDNLLINANGSFVFAVAINDAMAFDVSVFNQPTTPNQSCVVTKGNGNLAGSNYDNVRVHCTTLTYTIGGTLGGIAAGNSVTLQNNAVMV